MMHRKRLARRVPELSRDRLVNPHDSPYRDRVRVGGVIDLRLNFRLEQLERGYSRIVPVDPNRHTNA